MFQSVLIANRGEIAIRVIRACRDMGIKSTAVYSDADKDALHVRMADQAIHIGASIPLKSYLNVEAILKAAKDANVEAIHPGYGFLSESSDFAQAVEDAGLIWIGPRADILKHTGDKDATRASMQQAGLPIIEGSDVLRSIEDAVSTADRLGYPIILKRTHGGGGKAMYAAHSPAELQKILTKRIDITAVNYYIERYIQYARHIEVQIAADNYGHVIHLGERDCSLQRLNQKIIEETPSLALSPQMRQNVCDLAVRAARHLHYNNVGTVEFLFDMEQHKFYFLEVNPRVQVEHGVTEAVTGVDIVRQQIKIAQGLPLNWKQSDIKFNGHAIQCRINAEDPHKKFLPSPGAITFMSQPGGPQIRVDSSVTTGSEIAPFYDSLIAKIIAHGANRGDAILVMGRALHEFIMEGVKTNIDLHQCMMADMDFLAGNYDTRYVENKFIKSWSMAGIKPAKP